ncbi:uncharacterized protein [Rutidosis leptorrhynchoides]|uniref:uncharacterized protein n=1 Tax=Rutidosis leptorrhynchoides TaxID=125765 RepID=UPI003A999612
MVVTACLANCSGAPFHSKLKFLKQDFKSWNCNNRSQDNIRLVTLETEIKSLDIMLDNGLASHKDVSRRAMLMMERKNIEDLKVMDVRQKSRARWVLQGDENSGYFHGLLKIRRHSLFLESDFSREEIKLAVWDCRSDKAPGPDGFPFFFFKKYWDYLKEDVEAFVNNFMLISKLPNGSNSSFITLVPKVSNPVNVKDYRPISLIGAPYKIVAKILANRLSHVIDRIVSQEQTTFIRERKILDGPLMLSEIIDYYKTRHKSLMIFLVDFEKAFDSVNWKYLDFILNTLGFGRKWRSWIHGCLSSARTSILVNGSPTSEFDIKCGLRQGDPLSPFLFIIIMEGLHLAIVSSIRSNMLQGIKIDNLAFSHFMFADDVAFISEWCPQDLEHMLLILDNFFLESGLKLNVNKSSLFGVGVTEDQLIGLANRVGCLSGVLPFTFLGFIMGANMKRVAYWSKVIDKYRLRLSSWSAHLLSIGGRMTLIKLVLGSIGIYPFSLFRAPKTVLNSIESIRAKFFWGGDGNTRKMSRIKWDSALKDRDKCGLGINSLKPFNHALLLKWIWRILHNPDSLWAKLIVAIHGVGFGLGSNGCKTNGTWHGIVSLFNSLMSASYLPVNTLKRLVGNGCDTNFWHDVWVGDTPLAIKFNRLYHLASNQNCSVSDLWNGSSWTWSWRRQPANQVQVQLESLLILLQNVALTNSNDKWIWSIAQDGTFSVKDTRLYLDSVYLPTAHQSTRWHHFLPIKINIFVWRLLLNRLPTRFNLYIRGIDIDSIVCPTCCVAGESTDHTFISCNLAAAVWNRVKIWTGVSWPHLDNNEDLFNWVDLFAASSVAKSRLYCIVVSTFWWIWRFRNDNLFGSKTIKRSDIFDSIRMSSFTWLKTRSKIAPLCTDWLSCPL